MTNEERTTQKLVMLAAEMQRVNDRDLEAYLKRVMPLLIAEIDAARLDEAEWWWERRLGEVDDIAGEEERHIAALREGRGK